jgi:exosome complex RNA-binding protein Rrp42 (RNase PH superfamily)
MLIDTTSLVPASALRITDSEGEIKAYWVLYLDIVCISLDGNIFDTAWASIVAGLRSTRLPRAFWDADREQVMCNPDTAYCNPLEFEKASVYGIILHSLIRGGGRRTKVDFE